MRLPRVMMCPRIGRRNKACTYGGVGRCCTTQISLRAPPIGIWVHSRKSANRFFRKPYSFKDFSTEKFQNRGMFSKPQNQPSTYRTCHTFHR